MKNTTTIEQIRQQAKSYAFDNDGFGYDLNTCEDIFTDGAEWMKKEMFNKACEWLKENLPSALCRSDLYMFNGNFINDFKKAMEDKI